MSRFDRSVNTQFSVINISSVDGNGWMFILLMLVLSSFLVKMKKNVVQDVCFGIVIWLCIHGHFFLSVFQLHYYISCFWWDSRIVQGFIFVLDWWCHKHRGEMPSYIGFCFCLYLFVTLEILYWFSYSCVFCLLFCYYLHLSMVGGVSLTTSLILFMPDFINFHILEIYWTTC